MGSLLDEWALDETYRIISEFVFIIFVLIIIIFLISSSLVMFLTRRGSVKASSNGRPELRSLADRSRAKKSSELC